MRVVLPLPPPTNNLFFTAAHGKRVKSEAYTEWLNVAGWLVMGSAQKRKFSGPYVFEMSVPTKDRADVDGRIKAALDLFVKLGITPDDRHCRRVACERSDEVPQGKCVIMIDEAA